MAAMVHIGVDLVWLESEMLKSNGHHRHFLKGQEEGGAPQETKAIGESGWLWIGSKGLRGNLEERMARTHEMTVVMHIGVALVGLESDNVEKSWIRSSPCLCQQVRYQSRSRCGLHCRQTQRHRRKRRPATKTSMKAKAKS